MRKSILLYLLFGGALLLIGCSNEEASADVETAELLLEEPFADAGNWPVETARDGELAGEEPDGADGDTAVSSYSRINNGRYELYQRRPDFLWRLSRMRFSDVIIETTAVQNSDIINNAYGLVCRARNNGDGYYFLISGDGLYSIRRSEGGTVSPIVDWTESSAINQGQATNKIRAVCAGDYLALYVNGEFVAEDSDDHFSEGLTGFVIRGTADGAARIAFDELAVWEASRVR